VGKNFLKLQAKAHRKSHQFFNAHLRDGCGAEQQVETKLAKFCWPNIKRSINFILAHWYTSLSLFLSFPVFQLVLLLTDIDT